MASSWFPVPISAHNSTTTLLRALSCEDSITLCKQHLAYCYTVQLQTNLVDKMGKAVSRTSTLAAQMYDAQ